MPDQGRVEIALIIQDDPRRESSIIKPMQFDSFLTNLLFGLTLFTAFMSLAHSLGDVFCSRFFNRLEGDQRTRARIRVMTIVLCGLTALLVFLYKLGDENRERVDEISSAKIQMHQSNQGRGVAYLETKNFPRIDQSNSLTVRDLPSPEAVSELNVLQSLLHRIPTVHSLMSVGSAEICQSWLRSASESGVKIFHGKSFPQPGTPNVVLLCASDLSFQEQLPFLRPYVEGGGGVLVVGPIKAEATQSALAEVLGVKTWARPLRAPPTIVTLGGEFFSSGGMPSGLRVGLGPDWQGQDGAILAQLANEENGKDGQKPEAETRTDDQAGTAFVARAFGAGQVVWTSLPGQFSSRLNVLYGSYWKILTARVFTYLAGLPIVNVKSLPPSGEKLAIPMVIANYDVKSAAVVSEIFKKLGIQGSFYLSLSDSPTGAGVGPSSVANSLLADGFEIGAIDFSFDEVVKADFFSELAQYFNWREAYERLSLAKTTVEKTLLESDCCRMGAVVNPGAQAHAFAAASMVGFDFVAGFPYQDWISPVRMVVESTRQIQEKLIFAAKNSPPQKESSILTVLPVFTGADFQLQGTQHGVELSALATWLQKILADARWKGGAGVIPMHSHVLGTASVSDKLETALTQLKGDGVRFLSVGEYLRWWSSKSNLEWKLLSSTSQKIVYEIKNSGKTSAEDLKVQALGRAWRITEGEGLRLQAGEARNLIVERRP